ncbi:hypothetical protein EXE10_01595 [Acinetobacter sp. WCHAc060033]|nr:hypothetical protein EXE09_06300 [Acinetobacter sp. WCHAc060025]RZG88647.1 hypothetical protein EXE10_01595 [Acinetobacter sp. WCHAc060033]
MLSHTVECQVCGHVGATKSKGSVLVLIVLLLLFFPVGILYWLLNRKTKVCSSCSSSNVRLYRPQQANNRLHQSNSVQLLQCPDCREEIRFDARKCKHCGSVVE